MLVGFLTAAPYICGATCMALIGRRADATGERRLYLVECLLVAAIGFAGAGYFSHNFVILVLALCFIGAGAAGGIALINTLGQIGGIVSPIMVGRVKDVTGSATHALYVIAGLCIAAAMILLFMASHQVRANDRELDKA